MTGPLPLLVADCSRCSGLCCTATSLSRSADFAIDKPADRPCPNLREDFGCRIHDRLRDNGFPGCIAYDCLGAGQRITQETFGGRTWRDDPALAPTIFAAFMAMVGLHEVLWQAVQALDLPACEGPLRTSVLAAIEQTDALARLPADDLAGLDVARHLRPAIELVEQASARTRVALGGPDLRGTSQIEVDLRRRDLRGANLRGALLLGADLRGVDLTLADLAGADLRAARLGGANLAKALFLRPGQLESARGDARTRLPPGLRRPAHWR